MVVNSSLSVPFSPIAGVVTTPTSEDWSEWNQSLVVVRKSHIREGDVVVLFQDHANMDYTVMERKKVSAGRRGQFHHDDMIGKEYGSMVSSLTLRMELEFK